MTPATLAFAAAAVSIAAMEPGERIGTYDVLDVIGRGAMGVVYRARDPRLLRTVALKVVNPSYAEGRADAEARARLVEEARALARLSHPNVVPVFDAGVHDGCVYLAMELVDGIDVARWLKAEAPAWREVLDVFFDAARGLRAAHACGLVHRDFKPSNVLLGADGRARVVDFGLALAPTGPTISDEIVVAEATIDASPRLTRDGVVVGTPAYMAPEQHYGGPITAATDQFGFCVALYEALYGERPFRGLSWQLVLGKRRALSRPACAGDVPNELFPILARGMRHDPRQRFASMAELVRALKQVRRRRPRWLVPVVATATLTAIALPSIALSAPQTCRGVERTSAIWNRTVAAELELEFAATGLPHAPDTWQRTSVAIDEYIERWRSTYAASCRTSAREAELDQTMACLDARLRDAEALVELLRDPDEAAVHSAVESTRRLAPVEACAERLVATDPIPADLELRDRVEAIRNDIRRAAMLEDAGDYRDARELAREALAAADATDFAAVEAEALEQLAAAEDADGDHEAAAADFERAYFVAMEIGHDTLAAKAAIGLTWMHGSRTYEFAKAQRWAELARASLDRTGSDRSLAARLENALGVAAANQGRSDEALAHYTRTLELVDEHDAYGFAALANSGTVYQERDEHASALQAYDAALAWAHRELGPHHPKAAQLHDLIGNTLRSMGRLDHALAEHELAVAALEAALGPSHPLLARPLTNLARTAEKLGEPRRALVLYRRALDIEEANGNEMIASLTFTDAGNALIEAGYFDSARVYLRRSLELKERIYGAGHPEIGYALFGLAHLAMELGLHDEALVHYERAFAAAEARPDVATRVGPIAMNGIAAALSAKGQLTEALALHRRAVAGFEALGGESSVDVAITLFNMLDTLIALDRLEEARDAAARAVSILGDDRGWPELRADAERALADAEARLVSR